MGRGQAGCCPARLDRCSPPLPSPDPDTLLEGDDEHLTIADLSVAGALLGRSQPSSPAHAARVTVHVLEYSRGDFISEDVWLDRRLGSVGEVG